MKNVLKLTFVICILIMLPATKAMAQDPGTVDTLDNSEVYTFVDQMPKYPGGTEAMNKFLEQNLQYPKIAKENHIEGKVILSFIIEKDGSFSHIEQVGKKLGWGLDEEALRVLNSMPAWVSAKHNGQTVRCKYYLPIIFKYQ